MIISGLGETTEASNQLAGAQQTLEGVLSGLDPGAAARIKRVCDDIAALIGAIREGDKMVQAYTDRL